MTFVIGYNMEEGSESAATALLLKMHDIVSRFSRDSITASSQSPEYLDQESDRCVPRLDPSDTQGVGPVTELSASPAADGIATPSVSIYSYRKSAMRSLSYDLETSHVVVRLNG
jgi:hypothetical protein